MERASIPSRSSSISNRSQNTPIPTSSNQPQHGVIDNSAQRRPPKRGNSDGLQTLSEYISGPSGSTSATSHGSSRSASGARRASGGETWKDFLRESDRPSGTLSHQYGVGEQLRRTRTDPAGNTGDPSRLQGHDHGISARRKRVTSTAGEESQGKRRSYAGPSSSTPSAAAGSARDPIDLTSSPLTHRPLPHGNMQRHASNGSIIIPPWQPDQEVSQCPVCGTPFSIWYRRHHCRKCGRVVCANCSPHRITIPRQFIVQAPPPATSSPFGLFGLVAEDDQSSSRSPNPSSNIGVPLSRSQSAALGGGEVVRVCNPCVPDPNFSPPPQIPANVPSGVPSSPPITLAAPHLSSSTSIGPAQRRPPSPQDTYSTAQLAPAPRSPGQGPPGFPPGLAMFLAANPGATAFTQRDRNDSQPSQNPNQRATWLQSRHPPTHLPPAGPSNIPSYALPHNARLPQPPDLAAMYRHRYGMGSNQHPSELPLPPPPPRPRHQVKEEDECPVCGRELPPRGPDGDELARERHIEDCIRVHSASSSSVPRDTVQPSQSTSAPQVTHPNISITGSSAAATSSTSASASASTSAGRAAASPAHDTLLMPPPIRQDKHRMLVYEATEKDCVGEDGDRQECVICFVEYDEGDEMARLDCLCKFHLECIQQWWDTKGAGSCPTHQHYQ